MFKPVFKIKEDDDAYTLVNGDKGNIVTDIFGNKYAFVKSTLANDDFYEGLNMTGVIRGLADNILYGYSWWDSNGTDGDTQIESNGDEHGYEGYCEVEDDWDTYVSFYVFEPVEEWTYKGYRIV